MRRGFRTRYMRMTAVLLSAAVFMGSMDVNMLTVRAEQGDALYAEDDSETTGSLYVEEVSEAAENQVMEDSPKTADDLPEESRLTPEMLPQTDSDAEDITESVIDMKSLEESNDPTAQADGDDETQEPTGSLNVTISGITVTNKIYDGTPAVANGMLKAIVPQAVSPSKKDEDVTSQVSFSYSVSGTTTANDPWSGAGSNVSGNIMSGMPSDAGSYTLTVKVEDLSGKYEGSASYHFAITKKAVVITPKDVRKKIGDQRPAFDKKDDYRIDGLIKEEDLKTPPTLSCDVEETLKKPGEYLITASGADAGANYTITYQEGTLIVLEKEDVTISGITISDKVYDGEPVACDISKVQVIAKDSDNKDVKDEVTLNYSISGGMKDGSLYESTDLDKDRPVAAGSYTLRVTVTSDKYHGEYKKEFDITRKSVTLKAEDMEIKQGAKIPEKSDYTYTVTGLLESDGSKITKEPTFECDIVSTEKTGKYSITPKNASAGPNYMITYESGTLTVLEKDRITISGIKIEDKVYDGKPAVCDDTELKVVLNQNGTQSTELKDCKVTYEISGTTAGGSRYSSTNIETGMPTDAGQYELTLNVVSEVVDDAGNITNKYESSQEYEFTILPRPIIVKVNDVTIKAEDPLPVPSDFSYDKESMGMGFVGADQFRREPVFTCNIQNTDMVGTYDIVASDADAGSNYKITYQSGILTVEEKEVQKTKKLLRIITPNPVVNVENGISLDKMTLPETIDIVTRDLGAEETVLTEKKGTAGVTWERRTIDGTTYSVRNEEEQTFTIGGTVELPADVDGEGVSLEVKVQVSVREKYISRDAVASPTASVASGSGVRYGTTVTLSCETEDAEIYYTLDDKKPDRSSSRYTTPIEVKGFTVIRAYAYKKGYPDSSMVKFFYYINTSAGGNDADDPEVPKEDIPSSGIIPEGLWMTEVKEYTYTGQAIKPVVRVYDHKKLLIEKQDYTISYANNVKAADMNSSKAPSIIINGKGNYEGKITRRFTISPKDITDKDVSVDDITVLYNKKAQKPSPVILWNGKKLAVKKDYTISDTKYTEAGSYPITVTGTGNYKGTRTFNFVITADGILVSKLTVSKIPNQTYTGEVIKPQLVVKYKGAEVASSNYTVTYENNKEVGTATAVIKGLGSYVGTKKVTFKIVEVASLSKAKVELQFTNTPTYTGGQIRADQETVKINIKNADGQTEERTLTRNKDYTVEYANNVKAGTATAIFTGIGAYRGTIKKTFKIAACDVGRVSIRLNKLYSYVKGGCKAEPIVTFGGAVLKAGTDYTLAYKNNNKAGSVATLTIKGKGNFSGSVVREYEVTTRDMKEMSVDAADKVYSNKKNIYKTTVYVTDSNGKRLSAGKDYDKNFEYTYADNSFKKAGEAVDKEDIIPAGTEIRVTITAKGSDYSGTVSGTYRIVQASIAKAKVTIPVQSYTGKEIEPASEIRVELNGKLIPSTEYEIVGYSNNINKGTAKVILHGLHDYGGTKTATFKIKGKGLSSLIW